MSEALTIPSSSDLRTPEKDHITLRHLLTMQRFEWDEYVPYLGPISSERQMLPRWRFGLAPSLVTPRSRLELQRRLRRHHGGHYSDGTEIWLPLLIRNRYLLVTVQA